MSDILDNERFRKLLLSLPGKAVEYLYHHYYHSLLRLARSLTQDVRAAEDIVQETFVLVWEKHKWLGQYHEKSIQHYLVRVVKNKAITHYKKSLQFRNHKIEYINGNNFSLSESSIETNIIEAETRRALKKIIETFPTKERECLLMKLNDELTNEQIAIKLNVSIKAVERSVTSAYKRLRKQWK